MSLSSVLIHSVVSVEHRPPNIHISRCDDQLSAAGWFVRRALCPTCLVALGLLQLLPASVCPAKEGLVKEDLGGRGLDRGDGAVTSMFIPF